MTLRFSALSGTSVFGMNVLEQPLDAAAAARQSARVASASPRRGVAPPDVASLRTGEDWPIEHPNTRGARVIPSRAHIVNSSKHHAAPLARREDATALRAARQFRAAPREVDTARARAGPTRRPARRTRWRARRRSAPRGPWGP